MSNAFSCENTIFFDNSLVSSENLSAKAGYFGKMSTNAIALGTDNAAICVILDGGSASGDRVSVGRGRVRVIADDAINAGVLVSCTSTGTCKTSSTSDNPVGYSLGVAAAAGDYIWIDMSGPYDEAT